MDIFVGSLSFKLRESELREAFEKYGMVSSAKIIIDKITRQSKGFGFVEMPNEDEARTAIRALNGADMYGRPLVVNESQKREQRPSTGGPGDRYAGGGDRAPRSDFKREGFNRPPRPTEGDGANRNTGFQPRERSAGVGSDDDDDEEGASRPARPATGGSSFGGGFGGGGFGGGNAGSAPDRHRTPDRKPASQERRFNDRNNSANKADNRYSKGGEYYKKGGGGSKRDWSRGDDDDE